MKNNPLISFCIATYKRPEFLKRTITSILQQEYKNIEIIVSDNDSQGSAKSVIDGLNSQKIKYFKNKKNIGMVKNFNRALSKASGDFITFVSDDDPIEKQMLKILLPLYRKYPDADSFFGASSVEIIGKKIAEIKGFKEGITSLKSKLQKDSEIKIYTPSLFLRKFFTYQVTSYFLWSSGFARKTLVKKIGGMPDYGSPFLTDYVYICLLGSQGKMVHINKELARQIIHNENFGVKEEDMKTVPSAIEGFHRLLYPSVKKYKLERAYYTFITNWVIDYLVGYNTFYVKQNLFVNKVKILKIYNVLCEKFSFFKSRKLELYTKICFPFFSTPLWTIFYRIKRKSRYIALKFIS